MANGKPKKPAAEVLLVGLGQRVRSLREGRALTRKALAEQTGLSERFLAELEGGRGNISVLNLAHVASALGVTASSLLDDLPEAKPAAGVISLLGLRGAGKTSVGQSLAKALGVPFFELDKLVEAEAGMSLPEIFAIHGEEFFRALELRALKRFLSEHQRAVLATGGGIVASPDAYALLRSRTRTVWLRATPEEHWNRVVAQGDLRPMANRPQAMAELKRRLREREPLYAKADVTCVTTGRTLNEVVRELSAQAS